nr:MAG TPA: hypothetical protein [Caudoviricetes sp.]
MGSESNSSSGLLFVQVFGTILADVVASSLTDYSIQDKI